MINVSLPDKHGYCSYGVSVDCAKTAAEVAKTVIAQVNHRMPRCLGDSFIHVSDIDVAVEVDEPPVEIAKAIPDEIDMRIGRNVAELIEDGSTLQIGAGRVPDAVAQQLRDRKNLGIHTELLCESVVDLIECGAINGLCKTMDKGKIVATLMFGGQRLYDFVDDNPMLVMKPVEYTNDNEIIRRQYKMVSINSAIQVDLTGQISAESIGDRMFSGVGGQVDFIRGATLSEGGKSIIAIPATADGGNTSRIVPYLDFGGWVTTTRPLANYIVTEHGVANLRGKSVQERVAALISIAEPKFRDELEQAARERNWLSRKFF